MVTLAPLVVTRAVPPVLSCAAPLPLASIAAGEFPIERRETPVLVLPVPVIVTTPLAPAPAIITPVVRDAMLLSTTSEFALPVPTVNAVALVEAIDCVLVKALAVLSSAIVELASGTVMVLVVPALIPAALKAICLVMSDAF